MFPFDFLIAYLSTFATLKPGDMIVTGTPTGAGARFDPPRWLKPGDVVEVESIADRRAAQHRRGGAIAMLDQPTIERLARAWMRPSAARR